MCLFDSNDSVLLFLENKYDDDDDDSRPTPSAWLLHDAIFMRRHDTGDLVSLLKVIQSDEDGEAS